MKLIKLFKWTFFILSLLLVCGLIFRETLYRQFVSYKVVGQRTTYRATDKELIGYIDSNTKSFKPDNIDDIIKLSLQLTSKRLTFREAKNDNDPNKLIKTKNAHCVGYSAFFSATCNYLLHRFGYSNLWSSEPLIGQISFCGTNIHRFSKSSFFKNHDFNSITNKLTGEKHFVDPTINDYFGIIYVTPRPEAHNITRR